MKALSAAGMRLLDKRTIEETGCPGERLMRIAGALAASAIMDYIASLMKSEVYIRNVLILAGKGNNAGDAFFAAKMLACAGEYTVFLHCMAKGEELSPDARIMFGELPDRIKGRIRYGLEPSDINIPNTLVVDGLLGTGFHGELRGDYARWIRLANESGHHIVALDVPSGMDADTGMPAEEAVRADLTVTMANPKKGMLTEPGIRLCGRIRVLDIGIPRAFAEEIADGVECTSADDVKKCFPPEEFDIHKNSRGHVLVLGGSSLYSGAPLLAGEAALRAGAGLVSVGVPAHADFFAQVPKAVMVRRLPDDGRGFFNVRSAEAAADLEERADVIVMGPGMGRDSGSSVFLKDMLKTGKTVLADADALNLFAAEPSLLTGREGSGILVLTPHPGEMQRLEHAFGLDPSLSRIERTQKLAEKVHAYVILKGPRTVVAAPDGKYAVNLSGTPALATAGTGDVLAGIAGAMLARSSREDFSIFEALRGAVYLHGLAGELMNPAGSRGSTADDLLFFLQSAIKKIAPKG